MDFKIGDPIVIQNGNFSSMQIAGFSKVQSIKGNQVILENGTKWTKTGRAWGCASHRYYTGQRIDIPTLRDRETYDTERCQVSITKLVKRIEDLTDKLTLGELVQMHSAIKTYLDGLEAERNAREKQEM